MKAVVVESPEHVAVREIEQEPLGPGLVRIRVQCCLICTWEKRIYAGKAEKLPFVPGHEASGAIEAIGPGTVTTFRLGDRVVFKTLDHCGHCARCYSGETNLCTGTPRKRSYGGIPGSGGMAEFIDLEPGRVYKVAQNLEPEIAAFAEPLACCYHSVTRAGVSFADFVGISGGGIMGQLHALLALKRGAKVLLIEPDVAKAAHAAALGVHRVIDPFSEDTERAVAEFTDGEKLDVYFITTPQPSIAQAAPKLVRKAGKIVYYGSFHPNDPIPVDLNQVHYGEGWITGSFSATAEDFFRSSRLLSHGIIDPRPFLDGIYPISEAGEAFKTSLDPKTYRVGVRIAE